MAFSFLHKPPRKRRKSSWYENALLLAIAGSIIAVIGQLAGTVIPIMYGPSDISDFSLSAKPIFIDVNVIYKDSIPRSIDIPDAVDIIAEDSHKYLRPYKYDIYLPDSSSESSFVKHTETFSPPYIRPGTFSRMGISIEGVFGPRSMHNPHNYPIRIQGIGGDGKKRNTTVYLSIKLTKNTTEQRIGTIRSKEGAYQIYSRPEIPTKSRHNLT